MSNQDHLKTYWRSIEAREQMQQGVVPEQADEFPGQELVTLGRKVSNQKLGRRKFFGVVGATSAAGLATGCLRKPTEHILPFAKRPEDRIPGKAEYYATAYQVGSTVMGLLVESQDGRPIKIEGNPKHENSAGASDVWSQASVLSLYDPDRSVGPMRNDGGTLVDADWTAAGQAIVAALGAASGGEGIGLVMRDVMSPTMLATIRAFQNKYPKARLFVSDPAAGLASRAAAETLMGEGARLSYKVGRCSTIFAVDCDFLGTESDHTRLSMEYASGRQVENPGDRMNRLYAVEPHFTITGAQADHHLPVASHQVGNLLLGLAQELASVHSIKFDAALDGLVTAGSALEGEQAKFVKFLAQDLIASKSDKGWTGCVLVGERQPAWVHMLGVAINSAMGHFGNSARAHYQAGALPFAGVEELAAALTDKSVNTVLILDANPVYDAPGTLGLTDLLGSAKLVVHAGYSVDETARVAHWHLPVSHYLEAWGDLESSAATVSICQPLIDPLFDSRSCIELLNWMTTGKETQGYDIVQGHWRESLGLAYSDREWRRWLHDGVAAGVPRPSKSLRLENWDKVAEAVLAGSQAAPTEGWEVNFHIDPKVIDGRLANNMWLQELPHPMSKLTWDNAIYMSESEASRLGVANCDLVKVDVNGQSLTGPAWVSPGQADGTISVGLGYGREKFGRHADGAGVNAYPLQAGANPWFAGGGQVAKVVGKRMIYSTQDHGSMHPGVSYTGKDEPDNVGLTYPTRPIVRETTVKGFQENPDFAQEGDLMEKESLKSLWDHNEGVLGAPKLKGLQQWGMVIDLNKCTGCNTCTVACQSENNIATVGRSEIANGRELHWIRLDRYFSGDSSRPQATIQPMLCQHCETAPCESVCPVNATNHTPEGLNDMAYNRCVGTRYCANNCPYKVRRFNFFNYNRRMDETNGPIQTMVRNPDVTVRFRGVIEKCTYCVQRINEAKIKAHVDGVDIVKDGDIITACQQACPTQAITFGDVADPTTKVAKLRAQGRNYNVLQDLLTRPRTTYLGRVRNPNPDYV
ncbi:MAG: 4Fe-4S dicluster domain-containing protein [Nannocystaceae bacterium]